MTVAVLDVTTDNIRAALGLSEVELSDSRIADSMLEFQIQIKVRSVYPNYDTLKAVHVAPDDAKLWVLVQLYEMYCGAVFMLPQCQLIFAQLMMDGETSMARFQNNNLQDTIDRIVGQADLYAGLLNPTLYGVGLGFKVLNTATPNYDPVTGYPDFWLNPTILTDVGLLGITFPIGLGV